MAKKTIIEAPTLSRADEARQALHARYGTPLNRRMTRLAFAQVLGCPDDSYPMTDAEEPEFSRFRSQFHIADYCSNVAWWDGEALADVFRSLKPSEMFQALEAMVRAAQRITGPAAMAAWAICSATLITTEELGEAKWALNAAHRAERIASISRKINTGYATAALIYAEDPSLALAGN